MNADDIARLYYRISELQNAVESRDAIIANLQQMVNTLQSTLVEVTAENTRLRESA